MFTAAIHAREQLTITMLLKVLVTQLKHLSDVTTPDKTKSYFRGYDIDRFWRYNQLLFVPIINVDTVKLIYKSYPGPEGIKEGKPWQYQYKRKNSQSTPVKKGLKIENPYIMAGSESYDCRTGVDLNRNWDIGWEDYQGEDQSFFNPCSVFYRG